MLSPMTLDKGAKDHKGTEPVHLAKGQVTEAMGIGPGRLGLGG